MISVVILTKNSATYLERCLNVLNKFSEVVIVDNGSTDATIAIAARYPNVKIYEREFCGFGPLKNIGADLASNDWVLFVDSDEVLHPKLAEYILSLALDDSKVYQFYRKNYYDNLLIDGCSWDNDYVTRLFNRKVTRFNDNQVHESIITKELKVEKVAQTSERFIYHFPYTNTSQLMAKLEHYANLYAANNYGKKPVKLWMIPLKTIAAFIKNYLLKKGFKYGYEGFLISSYNTMGVLVKYLKLYELSRKKNLVMAIVVDDENVNFEEIVSSINSQKYLPTKLIVLISDQILSGNKNQIQQKFHEELIVPVKIIGFDTQDTQLILKSYLLELSEYDGVILFEHYNILKKSNSTYLSRKCILDDNFNQLQNAEFFQK